MSERTPSSGRRTMRLALAACALAALAASTAACSSGNSQRASGSASVVTSSTSSTSTTTTAASSTSAASSTATTAPAGAGDYEGQLYDLGLITSATRSGDTVRIGFDRVQLYTENGLASGKDFTTEPILYGNTDVPYKNDSTKVRTFVLSPGVKVLRIADPVPCASDDNPSDPVWTPITVDALVAGAWKDRQEDSLTFGPDGRVTVVRLSTAC